MGYWEQNEQGVSFAQAKNHEKMIWGDQPADIMGNALEEIFSVFQRDKGRPPTEAEVKAGLLFSLRGALNRAESAAKAPVCGNCREAGEPSEPLSAPATQG